MVVAAVPACDRITGPGNRPPAALGIPDQIVEVDSVAAVNLDAHFADPDGDSLTYTALSAAPLTAAVTLAGSMLAITGVAAGETTVTVTARDPEGLTAEQSFAVTVPNRAPVVADTIPDGEVYVDGTVTIEVAPYFADPDGDDLEYSAVSSDPERAAVALSESVLSVAGVAVGGATVTVTARDPEGLEAEQRFAVTVPNRAPEAVGAIDDRELEVDSVAAVDVAPHFTEPDGEMLEYAAVSSDPARVAVALSGGALTLTGVAKGTVRVTVTARDPHGSEASQGFAVTVPNRAPEAVGAVGDREIHVGDEVEIDVAEYFADADGDALEYGAVSSDTGRVAVVVAGGALTVTGAGVGGAAVTVTARDPEGLEAEHSFAVTVPNRAPEAVGAIADRELEVDGVAVLNVAPYFAEPDGEELGYAAASSDPARVAVALSGGALTLTGVAKGTVRVTVTARDPHGSEATQRFAVTVPNRGPQAVGAIADRELHVGDEVEIDVAAHFADPDGDALEYGAVSSDTGRVAVVVAGGALTVTGAGVGGAAVTVTARDPEGLEAEHSFAVTVPNRAPEAVGAIADRELEVDGVAVLDVAPYFAEPDGEELRYAAASSDPARVAVALSGGALTLTGVAKGTVGVTVTARDPHGSEAAQRFAVTVPNRGPEAVGAVGDREIHVGDEVEIDVAAHFADPDGDALEYGAVSSDTGRVAVVVAGGALTVTGAGVGGAAVTVTARDPEGLEAEQSFAVTVPNRGPEAVGAIADRELEVEGVAVLDVAPYFAEPDGEELGYAAVSSDPARVTVALSGSALTLTGVAKGTVRVTVTARDPHGLEAEHSFAVTVPNRAPEAVGAIADRELHVGDEVEIEVAEYFADPDGDALEYGAVSSDTGRVAVVVAGGALTVTGAGVGGAAVTVTARDPEGLEAEHSFAVTVPNRAPEAVGAVGDREIHVGDEVGIDVAAHFTDPDGDDLTYASESSATGVATVATSGSTVTVTAAGAGTATITVTATDPGGLSATQAFDVAVGSAPPSDLVVDPPSASPDALDPAETFTLSAVARNRGVGTAAAGTTLRYYRSADATIGTDDTEVGTDTVPLLGPSQTSAQSMQVTAPDDPGTYHYGACVDAVHNESDTGNNCSDAVAVEVAQPNRAPSAAGTIDDQSLDVGDEASIDVEPYFTDPDGDDLTYASESSATGVATVSTSGSTITVTGVALGEATVTVTATDPEGLSATQSFEVAVHLPNRAPVVTGPLPDIDAVAGWWYRSYLPDVFTDPDGDALTWTTISSNIAVAESTISGDSIVVDAFTGGLATVTVTATDPDGLSATDEFEVDVAVDSFDLELHFVDDFSDAQTEAIEEARDSWESILLLTELNDANLPDTVSCHGLTTTSLATVDDHLALVAVDSIDGLGRVVARAGYCYTRVSDGTPAVSSVIFDEVDIDTLLTLGSLPDVAFHEFAHALGFLDDYWDSHGVLNTADDPHFTGALAVEAFDAVGGTTYTGEKVPISSPDHSHWREAVFGREGMTPRLTVGVENPFSAVTLQAMADIGYRVDASLAEDYELPDTDMASEMAGRAFDLSGDVMRGPVIVIDADGRVVRVIPGPPGAIPPSFPRREVRIDRRESEGAGIWTRSRPRRSPPRR